MTVTVNNLDAIASIPFSALSGPEAGEAIRDGLIAEIRCLRAEVAQALDEVDVLGQCVQSLYSWIVELDPDPESVSSYLSQPHGVIAQAAVERWQDVDWTDR